MAITISGTDGIVGAGFTVDASGVSVTVVLELLVVLMQQLLD